MDLSTLEICDKLKGFSFQSKGPDSIAILAALSRENMRDVPHDEDLDDFLNPADNDNMPMQTLDEAFGFMGLGAGEEEWEEGEDGFDSANAHPNLIPSRTVGHEDYVMAMTENPDDFFDYFDSRITKNWAGPEHWKLHRFANVGSKPGQADKVMGRKKTDKEPFFINFTTEIDDAAHIKKLFAKATTTINLPRTQMYEGDKFILPVDFRLTSKDFFSLFLKPSVMITSRGRRFVRNVEAVNESDVQQFGSDGANFALGDYFEDGGFGKSFLL